MRPYSISISRAVFGTFVWLSASIAGAPPARALPNHTLPGTNGAIVFASNRANPSYYNLYLANADGTGLRRVTNAAANDSDPQLSPDATKVAFVRRTGAVDALFVVSIDGTNLRQLTTDGITGYVQWSPDGRRIVFADDDLDIEVLDVASPVNRRVLAAHDARRFHSQPTWSRDSTTIAFATMDFSDTTTVGRANIFVVRYDGTGLRRVTNAPDAVWYTAPAFSPDGLRIAAERDSFWLDGGTIDGRSEVVVFDVLGLVVLPVAGTTSIDASLIDWSWSSNRLLFTEEAHGGTGGSVYTMFPTTLGRTKAYDYASSDLDPVFSPDGARILYDNGTLRTVALNGTAPTTVSTRPLDREAAWGRRP